MWVFGAISSSLSKFENLILIYYEEIAQFLLEKPLFSRIAEVSACL
jgi:hypothetical protein